MLLGASLELPVHSRALQGTSCIIYLHFAISIDVFDATIAFCFLPWMIGRDHETFTRKIARGKKPLGEGNEEMVGEASFVYD